jgi:uncharacterized repeat protein (TIGR02543 family)
MRDYCGDTHKWEHFRLINDIVFPASSSWATPIGTLDAPFTGYFHGGNYKITGLKTTGGNSYAGLFGYNEGTIDSLYIEGTTIRGGEYVGGLVGYNAGSIIFCHTDINVDGTSISAISYAGGLAGYNTGIIQSSSAKGDVVAAGAVAAYSGGLLGYNNNDISNCFTGGEVIAEAFGESSTAYSGGLVGYMKSGSITDCYTTGAPYAEAGNGVTQYAGAIIGYNNGNIVNCYYNIENTNAPAAGNNNNGTASGKQTIGMQTRAVYVDWDFNTTWGITVNNYPYLREQPLRLKTLAVNNGTLTPAFHPDTLNYTVDANNTNIDIQASANPDVTISGNATHNLVTGSNPVPVTIRHHGGELTYTVTVHRQYTLNFDAQGGSVNPVNMDITSGVNALPVPVRQGYDFKEWNTKPDGDSIAFDDYTIQNASNITTLYAQWKAKTYTLKFDPAEGSVSPTSKTVTYGSPVGELPTPTRAGYEFNGWNDMQDGSGKTYASDTVYRKTSDTTVYAQWQEKTFNLHFDANFAGGVDPSDQSVTYGKSVGTLPTTTRPGYTFLEWNTQSNGGGDTYTSTTVYMENKDVTLYAQWTVNEYTLKFDAQGGSPKPSSIKITYGASVGTLPVLNSRPHYIFKEWNTKPDGSGTIYADNAPYMIAGDTTFFAVWEGEPHAISFDINYSGGINPQSRTVNYGSAVGTLPERTRTGYTFGGWNTQKDGSGATYIETTVYEETNSITLYAQWTVKTLKLKYDAQGGTVTPSSKSVKYGDKLGDLPTPVKAYYTFNGWNAAPDGTGDTYTSSTFYEIDHDTTIYAQWRGESHLLMFDAQGGTTNPHVETKIVLYGSPVGELPQPQRAGYDFAGWFTGIGGGGEKYESTTLCTASPTLYAHWTAQTYKIFFDGNGGSVMPSDIDVKYGDIIGGNLSIILASRTNYTFTGWKDSKGNLYDENTKYEVAGNITLYAQWEGKKYTLSFISDAGPNPASRQVAYGSPVGELPTIGCPGYTPAWMANKADINTVYFPDTPMPGDVTLYANCTTPNEYKLSFDAQGGTVNTTSKQVTYDAVAGELPFPDRQGYTFDGWYTETEGAGNQYTSSTIYKVADNLTLYAKWKGNDYELSFDAKEGDQSPTPISVTYGSQVGTLPSPGDKFNYAFIEWNTKEDGSGTTYTSTTYHLIPGNVILYAIWRGKPLILKFESNASSVPNPDDRTVYYGSAVGQLPENIRPGYIPTWNTIIDGSGFNYTATTIATTDMTLYAQWATRKYTVNFNYNYAGGGTYPPITDIYYGSVISAGTGGFPTTDPVRTFYEFKGWITEPNSDDVNSVNENTTYLFDDDITLYAKWKGVQCTLDFYDGDAQHQYTKHVDYGSPVGNLYELSKQGYKLAWNTQSNCNGKFFIPATKYEEETTTTNLYACWTPETYTLYFDAQDGNTAYKNKTVTYYAPVGSFPSFDELARTGYDLKWNTKSDGTGVYYTPDTIYKNAHNTTLYALWIPREYTLSFDANGGTPLSSSEASRLIKYDSQLTNLPVPERTGYDFKEWNTEKTGLGTVCINGDTYKEIKNTILYAQWTAKEYTVTFKNNGGGKIDIPDYRTVTYGEPTGDGKPVKGLPDANRDNYIFSGWNTKPDGSGDICHEWTVYRETRDTVLYAQWTPIEYKVTFDVEDGEVSPESKIVNYGSKLDPPTPTRTGYKFVEWRYKNGTTPYDNSHGYSVSGDTTLYAYWDLAIYTITYNANHTDATTPSLLPEHKPYNSSFKLPGLYCTGYTHTGWNTSKYANGDYYDVGESFTVTGDTTLYAQWDINKYTVTFETEGGISEEQLSREVTYLLPTGKFPVTSREGHTLKGWFTKPEGDGVQYTADSVVRNDIQLYAYWEINSYTLTCDGNYAGAAITQQSVTHGSDFTLQTLTRTGYTHTGWNTKADGSGASYSKNETVSVTGNITLYAQWAVNTYTVTFEAEKGVCSETERKAGYGSKIGKLPVPSRDGYEFEGWFTAQTDGTQYDANTTVTDDITVYAHWKPVYYALRFDVNYQESTTSIPDMLLTYGASVGQLPNVPARTGYTFTGWNTQRDGNGEIYYSNAPYMALQDITLYAQWSAETYTIVFDSQGGGSVDNKSVTYKTAIGSLPVPDKKKGYIFDGWNTKKDGSGVRYTENTVYNETAGITLYAQWTADSYVLQFDAQGGSSVNNMPVTYEHATGALPVPTFSGYEFGGWFTGKDGGGAEYTATTNYTVAGNTTLYAKWTAKDYYIEFNANCQGCVNPAKQSVSYDNFIITLPVITRPGYTFKEWNTAQDGSGTKYSTETVYTVTGNTVLYAQWTVNSYMISFNANYAEGINPASQNVTYDAATGSLPSLTRTGYTFKGWNTAKDGSGVTYTETDIYDIAGNATMYAQWAANSYLLIFDVRGGVSIDNLRAVYNEAVGTLPVTSCENYTFGGWFTEINGGTEYTSATVYTLTGNTVLYAKWIANTYVISFDVQGGNTVSSMSVTYGDLTGTLPVPERAGYTFKGWNASADGSGEAYAETTRYTANGNILLYAQWTANSYRLSFDTQSENTVADLTVTYNSAVGELPYVSSSGYTFDGWFTGIDGSGIEYTSTTVHNIAGNTTLYAKWSANSYTLEFNANYAGSVNPADQRVTYDRTVTALPEVTRPGYVFKEWNTLQDGSGARYTVATVYTVAGNTVLYAQWTADTYTVSFEVNCPGSITKPENPSPQNIVYGTAVGTLPVPARAGYIFTGWNTAENGSGTAYTETTVYSETGNITLYAQWTGVSYTVNFTGNNVEIEQQVVVHGAKIIKPSAPILQGYVFGGWYKDNDLWDFNTPVTGDVLLTAKWLSSDTELQSLTVTQGSLSPEFKPSITDYNVLVSYDAATISVTGLQRHSGASVTGNVESKPLVVGDNIIKVKVTAEDGVNTSVYTVLVTRADHILGIEANLISLWANNRPVTIEGNTLEYVAACGETSFALKLDASPYASVAVNGLPYSKGQVIELTGDVTTTDIHIVSETGASKDYILKANTAINENRLYYKRWPDILGINANFDNNGGYEVLGYRWYRHDGSPAGDKGYIQMLSSQDYAEIRTVQTEGWRRVCGTPETQAYGKIMAYPNPVPSGTSLKLEIPEQYTGATLNIYDITGALLKSGLSLPATVNSIDLSGFNSGIYLLNIIGKDGDRQSVKIIVE